MNLKRFEDLSTIVDSGLASGDDESLRTSLVSKSASFRQMDEGLRPRQLGDIPMWQISIQYSARGSLV